MPPLAPIFGAACAGAHRRASAHPSEPVSCDTPAAQREIDTRLGPGTNHAIGKATVCRFVPCGWPGRRELWRDLRINRGRQSVLMQKAPGPNMLAAYRKPPVCFAVVANLSAQRSGYSRHAGLPMPLSHGSSSAIPAPTASLRTPDKQQRRVGGTHDKNRHP